MAEVVSQADGLDKVLVAAQRARQGAADLGDLEGVGQAGAEIIALEVDENLGLVFEAAEGGGVDDAVAVALEGGAVIGLVVQVGAAFAVPAAHAIGGKTLILDLLKLLAVE